MAFELCELFATMQLQFWRVFNDLGSPACKRMLFGSRPESCFSARKLKEVFGVPVSCVTVRGYLHLVLWDTSELLVLCVTLVFYVMDHFLPSSNANKKPKQDSREGWTLEQFFRTKETKTR